jgi:two-component system sensor histidine kinase KdpD
MYNIAITVVTLLAAFIICLVLNRFIDAKSIIPAIFSLAVFLIARYTDAYVYGVIASLISVLAVNYAFTFPYMAFGFTLVDDIVTAAVMLAITIMTSTLITQIKKQKNLRLDSEKEKMRANLLRAISHDLRTPLTTIYGSSDVLLSNKDKISPERQEELLTGIRDDSQWLIRMVENLLSVTKMDSEQGVRLKKVPVVLEELIDTVIVKFNRRHPDFQIRINIPDEFISIPMDSVLIEQVLLNLLENAVQHATGMTHLTLQVLVRKQHILFRIKDDGCGIEEFTIASLFDGSVSSMTVGDHTRGMGIGLPVCATIVAAHQGKIGAFNRKKGGCCFWFTLPLED